MLFSRAPGTKNFLAASCTLLLVAVSLPSAYCQNRPLPQTEDLLQAVLAPLPSVTKSSPSGTANVADDSKPTAEDLVSFTKRIYSALGSIDNYKKTTEELADDFKGEYATLNWDGSLGEKLEALQEMRLLDLQLSVRHARKMRDLLDILDVGPASPHPNESNEVNVPLPHEDGAELPLPSLTTAATVAADGSNIDDSYDAKPATVESEHEAEAPLPLVIQAAAVKNSKA